MCWSNVAGFSSTTLVSILFLYFYFSILTLSQETLDRMSFHFTIRRGSVKICDQEQAARTDQRGAMPFATLIFENLQTAFFPPNPTQKPTTRLAQFVNETKVCLTL